MRRVLGTIAAASLVAVTLVPAPSEAAWVSTPGHVRAVRTTATTLTLDWAARRSARGYRVQVSRSSGMAHARYYRFPTSRGRVAGLQPQSRYYFRVSVLGSGSRRVSRYTPRPYPTSMTKAVSAPTRLTVGAATTSSLRLTWKASPGAILYRISTSPSAGFSPVTRLRSAGTSATVRGLASARKYHFRVKAIRLDGTSASRFGSTVTGTTAAEPSQSDPPVVDGPADIRVGSYNVQSVSLDKTDGEQRPWANRRAAVLRTILGEDVDVVGIQEANASSFFADRLIDGTNQFLDIRNGLDAGGQDFELTNAFAANCVNAATTRNCTPQDRGASGSDRILYNVDRISVVSQGGYLYPTQDPGGTPRNLAWAVLKVKRTGDAFLFTSTHLEAHSGSEPVRRAQWLQMIALVQSLRADLPVVSVGDYNVQKYAPLAEELLPRMRQANLGDVVGQRYATNPGTIRPLHMVNGWVNSFNHLDRNVANTSYEDHRDRTGNNIDWIFATNSLVAKEWKVVADFDPSTLRFNGIIASDHNMVRATITLP